MVSCADHSGVKNICKQAIDKPPLCRVWARTRDKASNFERVKLAGEIGLFFFSPAGCQVPGVNTTC